MPRNFLYCQLILLLFAGLKSQAQTGSVMPLLERKITMTVEDRPISEVIQFLGEHTGIAFFYSPTGIRSDRKMSFSVRNKSLGDCLQLYFVAQHIRYQVLDDKILLSADPSGEDIPPIVFRGQVTDEKHQPIAGASIIVKGTRVGTSTSLDGQFNLPFRWTGSGSLLVTCVGYQFRQLPLTGSFIQVMLMPEQPGSFDTMVVVGYGKTRRKDLTTSMGSITSGQLSERPTAINILEGMQGKVAGVSVLNNSGKPGGAPSVIVRGAASINASSSPLYVVDGIVGADPLLVDPHIIQSMDILKDAAATSVYGARGANGVVIITTNQARKGMNALTFTHTTSFGTLQHELKLLDADGALEMFKRIYAYTGQLSPNLDPNNSFQRKAELFTSDGRPRYHTDWQKEATHTAISNNSSLTFASGKENLASLLTLSYKDQQGILLNSDIKQLNLFANISADARPWLHLQGILNMGGQQGSNVDLNLFGLNAIREIYEYLPFLPVRYADGTYSMKGDFPGAENSENPVKLLNEVQDKTGTLYSNASFIAVIHLSPSLDLTTSWGGQLNATYHNYYSAKDVYDYSLTQNGVAQRSNGTLGSWTNEDYLTWKKQLGKHNFNIVTGASWYYTVNTNTSAGSENFFDNVFSYNSLQTGTIYEQPTSSRSEFSFNSYYLRANYSYDNRFFLGSSIRIDGSSRFGANNKYGEFPSVSAAWKVSNESFFTSLRNRISSLKVRASFGAVGNAEIQNYSSLNQLSTNQVIFSGQPQSGVVLAPNAGNINLKWEKQLQSDLGLDAGIFNDRLELTADYYNKLTSNMLYQKQLPATTGYMTVWDNIGRVRNHGLELSVTSKNILSGDFSWITTFNYAANRSKILDLNGDIFTTWVGRLEKGRSMDEFYGYIRTKAWGTGEATQAALYNNKPGDIHWLDRNKDGVLDANDEAYLGHKMPLYEMDLTNTFHYKYFSLYIDLQYLGGNKVMDFTRYIMASETPQTNSYHYILDAWTPDHQNTVEGELRPGTQPSMNYTDNYNIQDGACLRVRNITIGYELPPRLLQRLSFSKAVLSLTAENYFLFTKYTGYDPEVTPFDGTLNQGVDVYQYPKAKTLAINLNISF